MSPSLELQGAVVARLKADSVVGSIAADRIYDYVPRAPTGDISAEFPFVGIASWDGITDDADCIPGSSFSFDLDCWSRAVGLPEVHRLSEAVKQALHDDDTITLTTNALVYLVHRQTRTFRDQDGLSNHAVLTFEAYVEQP
jgi:hypothetical protein